MIPLCLEEKIGVTPYTPLASGRLARPTSETTARYEKDPITKQKYDATAEADQLVVARVEKTAEKHALPMSNIALSWLLNQASVVAPVIGATQISHLESAVAAIDVKLTPEEVAYLEGPYVPHSIVGLIPYGGH